MSRGIQRCACGRLLRSDALGNTSQDRRQGHTLPRPESNTVLQQKGQSSLEKKPMDL